MAIRDFHKDDLHCGGCPALTNLDFSDQVKSLDWRARRVEPICTLPADTVAENQGKLGTLLF